VVMTGAGTIVTAVEAMKAGALDYVLKPFELSAILPVLSRALTMRRLRVENLALHRRVEERTGELETANRALRKSEEELRTLAHWAMQVQEIESAELSLALHDNITQLLCAIQVRTQALSNKLPARVGPAKREFVKLGEMLGDAAAEVERISRDLRPGALDILGLVAVLRASGAEFAKHTGVSVTLDCAPLTAQLSAEVELALYRILQAALNNVAQHARARHVTVCLEQTAGFIQLAIKDDGVGFEPGSPLDGKETSGLGLLRIRERAAYVGGVLEVKSARNAGTQIEVRISLPGCFSIPSRLPRGRNPSPKPSGLLDTSARR